MKEKQGKGLKRLTPKQMLQRLTIALAHVKVGNISKNLLNEIRKIRYCLYQSKEITKKVYNNIMNIIKILYKMNTIFMNSENSETSDPHRLSLNLTDKVDLRQKDKCVSLSNSSIYYTCKKYKKSHTRITNLRWISWFELPDGSYSL